MGAAEHSNRQTRNCAATPENIAAAATALRAGQLVAFPTETVYGLGADATNGAAVAGIYQAKGRPSFNPLIAHVADAEAAFQEGMFSEAAKRLANAFWPGPLTLVVPLNPSSKISDLARAGLDSIGLRVPSHPVAHALLKAVARPIAAPSANRSGHVSPTTASHVAEDLATRIDMILDGGACDVGVESTILSCLEDTPRILRPGGISRAQIEAVLGHALPEEDGQTPGEAIVAPGMLASHYAPKARLRLNARDLRPRETGLDFGHSFGGMAARDLSPTGDLAEAAANLFTFLRAMDSEGHATIAIAPIPQEGLGEAINDRLTRAAAPR